MTTEQRTTTIARLRELQRPDGGLESPRWVPETVRRHSQ